MPLAATKNISLGCGLNGQFINVFVHSLLENYPDISMRSPAFLLVVESATVSKQ